MIYESGIIYWRIHRGWVGVADPPPPLFEFQNKEKNVTKQSKNRRKQKKKTERVT